MKIVLKPYETMKRRRATERLAIDAEKIMSAVKSNPGVPSKSAIAALTGLSHGRVDQVIYRINNEEVGGPRIDYGEAKATGGPNAGRVVRGWFVQNRKAHHAAMDHADEHSALIEVGVRRSRLVRFAQAQGIPYSEGTVESIEERLGLSVEAMTQADLEAFEELLTEAAEEGS